MYYLSDQRLRRARGARRVKGRVSDNTVRTLAPGKRRAAGRIRMTVASMKRNEVPNCQNLRIHEDASDRPGITKHTRTKQRNT